MGLVLVNERFVRTTTPTDESRSDAVKQAEQLLKQYGAKLCISATVSKIGGLMLVIATPNGKIGCRFQYPSAGRDNSATLASAKILAMFGFGPIEEIFKRISVGGDNASFPYEK